MAESVHHLLCNGADAVIPVGAKTLRLDYRADKQRNVRIELPGFVQQLLHVPPRLLDLLEIAAYVYAQIDGATVVQKTLSIPRHGVVTSFST